MIIQTIISILCISTCISASAPSETIEFDQSKYPYLYNFIYLHPHTVEFVTTTLINIAQGVAKMKKDNIPAQYIHSQEQRCFQLIHELQRALQDPEILLTSAQRQKFENAIHNTEVIVWGKPDRG